MQEYWGLWLLLMATSCLVRGDLKCMETDTCDCTNLSRLEFKCPPSHNQVIINIIPETIKVECTTKSELNMDMLPNIQLGDLKTFLMKYCQLPTYGFNEILDKFKIGKIKVMKLLHAKNRYVSKQLFYGLARLQHLNLQMSRSKFEEDFLEYVPDLLTLVLEYSGIREVTAEMFKYIPKLITLDLSGNSISDLPDGVFQHLSNLRHIYLLNNLLNTLKRTAFIGLKHLESLFLDENNITYLNEDTFAELTKLKKLSLEKNNLQRISSNTFKHNMALESIVIQLNPNLILSDYVFANLTKLLNVNVDNTNLVSLPRHIFLGCSKLSQISLKNNKITQLSPVIFENLNNLKKLYLSGNKIKIFPKEIITSLISLEELYLQDNKLEEIDGNVCKKSTNLIKLNLSFNNISDIYKKITSPYNAWEGIMDPFKYCESLQDLNLSHNSIKTFPNNIMRDKSRLKSVDLSYNQISEIRMASLVSPYFVKVYVQNNKVSVLDFVELKQQIKANKTVFNKTGTILFLLNNPIKCDCHSFDLIQYYNNKLDPLVKKLVDIRGENLLCTTPQSLAKSPVMKLKPHDIICPFFGAGCPKGCDCAYQPSDKHALVNCSNRNLTNCPSLNLPYDKIVVNLDGNLILTAPYRGLGYENVTKLNLSNNKIRSIGWIPPKIRMLILNGNQLKFLDPKVLDALNRSSTLDHLELHENPWSCNCTATAFQNFLQTHYTKVKSDVICADTKEPLIAREDLCNSQLITAMTIAIPILVVLLTMTTLIALYFHYKDQIKIWLYANNLCLWWVTEEELDKDKTYDVFISYSHKDEEFVSQNLLPVLEQGQDPYKVCIHNRDWIPGELIAKQVTSSVLDSRRTLVVLSESFLESVWGKMEFRAAHMQAISEGRERVIVLKYGHLDEKLLDNELKAYLKTKTYVEWGDPWFWYKLKYALPHSKRNRFFDNNGNKHTSVMINIDKKFECGNFSLKTSDSVESEDEAKTKTGAVNPSSDIQLNEIRI